MPLDDHEWTRNVERFAAELASVQELSADEVDSKRAADLLAAAAPLFDEVLRAIQQEPHDQDLRLRAGALVESVLAVPVALVARQAEIASPTSTADALRTLASGPDQSVIADTRNFDDASDRILDIAAGDFLAASTALGPAPAVAAALRGEFAPLRSARSDGASIDATVSLFCESLRPFLAGVASAVFDRVATDLAATVAEAAARVTRDSSHAAARYAVWRLLDDAALHAAAASRRADPWQLGRSVASFELSRRWVAPLVAVESFLAERAAPGAGDESATPGARQAASAIGLGLVLWAARDHLSSRQLDWLPRVYEPPLI